MAIWIKLMPIKTRKNFIQEKLSVSHQASIAPNNTGTIDAVKKGARIALSHT